MTAELYKMKGAGGNNLFGMYDIPSSRTYLRAPSAFHSRARTFGAAATREMCRDGEGQYAGLPLAAGNLIGVMIIAVSAEAVHLQCPLQADDAALDRLDDQKCRQ